MKSPEQTTTTLNDLVSSAALWDAEFSELALEGDGLEFDPNGVVHKGTLIPIDKASRTQLFNKFGAPGDYLERHSPELQAAILTELAALGKFGQHPTLVMQHGNFLTIAKGELRYLAIGDVIRAVQEGLGNESDGLLVTRISGYPEKIDVELASPNKEIAVRPGDIVQAGLRIVHERFGNKATLIESFIYRLVCTNGMTRRQCSGEGFARTRRLPVTLANSRELQMGQLRRLASHNWDGLQAQLETLRDTSERPARVRELLTQWLRNVRISPDTMLDRLLTAWEEEGRENTFYGAVNALTRVATHHHDLSERQRHVLGSLAGILAFSANHLCERCFSVLARAHAEEHAAQVMAQ
jgi:Domain of unknown function (DUF932)